LEALVNFMHFILAVAWSFAFLDCLVDETRLRFFQSVRCIAAEADMRAKVKRTKNLETRTVADTTTIQTRSGVRPTLLVNLPGMVVVHKPTDWEVDGAAAAEGCAHPPLSAFMQSLFPLEHFPLVWSPEQSFGFLHRLDIPSSGLVLAGTSFEGYFWLRLQLDTQRLRREYMVICEGLPAASLGKVVARVDVAPEPSQRRSINDSGKPSQTWVRLQTHFRGSPELGPARLCITAIRILTGRRHQIRVHMRHSGHPTLADARYTCREVLLAPVNGTEASLCLTATGLPPAMARLSGGLGGSGSSVRRWTYNAVVGQV